MAVKKPAKKITKKISKAKKSVPKLKRITAEELAAVLAENHAKTEAAIEAAIEAAVEKMSEGIRQLSIQNQKTAEENRKTAEEVRKTTKSLNESYGRISQRLGNLTELIVVPKIRQDMNAQGHKFDYAEVNALIRGVINGRKEDIAEVDMLLHGPAEAMAVEIKTRLKESHVKDHIEQLQNLRDHEDEADINGKKLFGAVVGIAVDEKAREIAKKNGLYVVEIREEEDKLKIDKPEQCRIW
jgi:hypothetical protein